MEEDYESPPSLKHRLRRAFCLSYCFSSTPTRRNSRSSEKSTLLRSSSTWLKSRAQDLPDFGHVIGRRRSPSSYDPLSYALNFDDSDGDDGPLRSFSVGKVPTTLKVVPEMKEISCT